MVYLSSANFLPMSSFITGFECSKQMSSRDRQVYSYHLVMFLTTFNDIKILFSSLARDRKLRNGIICASRSDSRLYRWYDETPSIDIPTFYLGVAPSLHAYFRPHACTIFFPSFEKCGLGEVTKLV